MKKIREEFADTMLEIGSKDKTLVVMVGDISHGLLEPFSKACKGRYFNIGICEPSIINLAAGLSLTGLNPVVHTIAPFITERAYEQIKLDFGYQKLGINIVSVGGAFDYSQLGCTHHCYSDVSILSHLSDANIIVPGSAKEFNSLFKQIYENGKINYFKIPENPHGIKIEDKEVLFGKGNIIKEGSDITVVTFGTQLRNVVEASEILSTLEINVEIIYLHTLKPFDFEVISNSVQKTKCFLTVEELSSHDGLFNLCLKACVGIEGVKCKQMAINDFIYGYGTYESLCEKAGLTLNNILREVKKIKSS